MHHTASRSLVAEWHIVTCLCLKLCGSGQWQRLGTAIAKMQICIGQLLCKVGSMSAVALDVLASPRLRLVAGFHVQPLLVLRSYGKVT